MATATQTARLLSIDTPAGEDVLLINGFTATKRLSGLFDIRDQFTGVRDRAGQATTTITPCLNYGA